MGAPASGPPNVTSTDPWAASRSGSHAGRGFRYQHAVAAALAVLAWQGELPLRRLVPEGLEDISLELDGHWLHLQARSRREHRGQFAVSDLTAAWRKLAERLRADPSARAGLVLERPLLGVDATGLDTTLGDLDSPEIAREARSAVGSLIDVDDFLARTHLVEMPSPQQLAIELLADSLRLPPGSCVAHQAILCDRVAELAAANGIRTAEDPAALSVGDIARLLDDMSEAIDPAALDEAVREGIAELVDFATPIEDERFFGGVDVVVGHVVAGLPLERPEIEELLGGLQARGYALAIGPSGAGKSALIWLAAYAWRHQVRWYRLRRLREADVPALVRLVRGFRPTGARIGLVIDDVGRHDRDGIDHLVEELRHEPAALVLGACREEDLLMVRTARGSAQVRPLLGADLAERIWRELRERGDTSLPEWREAYERSGKLLLEYGHLLTEGTRLAETVAAQIEQRVREQRALELELLARVATADAFGVEIEVARLTTDLATDVAQMKRALARLVAEHLIYERDGRLGGLHELRSRHLMHEIHRLPPPTMDDTLPRVVAVLDGGSLQQFLTRSLLERATADEVAIDAVVERLAYEPEPLALAAALLALRIVGFRRMVPQWRDIVIAEGAPPTDITVIAHFALKGDGHDDEILPEPTRRAIGRIRALAAVDLRRPLLERLGSSIWRIIAQPADVGSAVIVLGSLSEIGPELAGGVDALAPLVDGASLAEVRMLLESAYAASPDLAIELAERLGGSASLLERLGREQPWVRNPRIATNAEGRLIVEADYAFVAESVQPEPHGAVVELARYLAALTPSADVAACRAIDATGALAGFGHALADVAIPRENLPCPAVVAWNRARLAAAAEAVAAATETDYLLAAREIVTDSARLVRRATSAWLRRKPATDGLYKQAMALAETAHLLPPAPLATLAVGPLEEISLPPADPASFVGTMIASNLLVGLFDDESVAPLIGLIIGRVDDLASLDGWRLLTEPPTAELAELRRLLVDLHAIVSERGHGDRLTQVALAAAAKNGLAAAASVARQRASVRMRTRARQLETAIANAGFCGRILCRPGAPDSELWPDDEFLVLVDVTTLADWPRQAEALADLCRPILHDRISFHIAPVRAGRVVASHGLVVVTNIFPDDSVRTWPNVPLVDERLGDAVRCAIAGLVEASGIIATIARDVLHDEEMAALDAASESVRESLRNVAALASEDPGQLLDEVSDALIQLGQRVESEADAWNQGRPVERGVAASALAGIRGEHDDVSHALVGMSYLCAEWDIEPAGAWERLMEVEVVADGGGDP